MVAIGESLGPVAPEADLNALAPDAGLRDTLELDSLDFLNFVNFVEALTERAGRRSEEDDQPHLATLASGIKFLARG